MPSMPVTCLVCGASVKDSQFPIHMSSVHGGLSQGEALQAQKNIPPQQSPIVLDKDAPISDSFMEVARMLDKPQEAPKKAPPVDNIVGGSPMGNNQQEAKPKEIKLEYHYSGQCKDCKTDVATLVVKVKGQTVAVAFCNSHGQLKEREVVDLEEKNIVKLLEEKKDRSQRIGKLLINNLNKNLEKKYGKAGVKRAKQRHKPKLLNSASVQDKMLAPRLSGSDKPSIQS